MTSSGIFRRRRKEPHTRHRLSIPSQNLAATLRGIFSQSVTCACKPLLGEPAHRRRSQLARNPLVRDILSKYSQVWAINHSLAVLGWDTETHMPEAGARPRGIASGQLAVMVQRATITASWPEDRKSTRLNSSHDQISY